MEWPKKIMAGLLVFICYIRFCLEIWEKYFKYIVGLVFAYFSYRIFSQTNLRFLRALDILDSKA